MDAQRRRGLLARMTITAVGATALLAGACSSSGDERGLDDLRLVAALQPFAACDDLLDHLRGEALDQVGSWGLGGQMYGYATDMVMPATAGGQSGCSCFMAATPRGSSTSRITSPFRAK